MLRFDFGFEFSQLLGILVHQHELFLKYLLQVEKLLLEIVDLLILWLQACTHLLCPVRQHMFRLAQIFDLELVLVQVSGPLLQLLDHFLILQLEQLDLFSLLLKFQYHFLAFGLCSLVILLSFIALDLESLLNQTRCFLIQLIAGP